MASSWLCSGSAAGRPQFVRLVFPGGQVELLDHPVLAGEVMMQHPRFCVAHPDVFREPAAAVAAPDEVLALGRKYYVVPASTVRKLQRHSPRRLGSSPRVTPRRAASAGRGMSYWSGKRWFGCLVSRGSRTGSPEMRKAKESWEKETGGSPGWRGPGSSPSPGMTSAHSWQPSLQSITEE